MNHHRQHTNLLKTTLICLTIALILRLIFDAVQARGEVVVNFTPMEVRYALVQNMTKHGYKVVWINAGTIYFAYPGVTYLGQAQQCTEQRFKFVLRADEGRTAISGFAVCYAKPENLLYSPIQMDSIILDAFQEHH